MKTLREPARDVPVVAEADVVVCGGGPAGIAAALASARTGAHTVLLETHGCLGGVWTAGALSWIIDASNKRGIMAELTKALEDRGARAGATRNFGYDVETMKIVLDELILGAGVNVQLYTRVVAASLDTANTVDAVVTESKSGRQAWRPRATIDATGDGDVAAQAGCGYDIGHPQTGDTQPMTLMALLTGINLDQVEAFVAGGIEHPSSAGEATRFREGTLRLLAELERAGIRPSYTRPTLWCIYGDVFALMANHEYGASALDAADLTRATMQARSEVNAIVAALRSLGEPWSGLRLVATGAQIGVREGRRIHGRYRVTKTDLLQGTDHTDAVCRVTYGVDVHALSPAEGGFLSKTATALETRTQAYDIPMRALIARDVDGLLLAGRCISGDFLAHSSYRVTGNAVAMGQAAGVAAAVAALSSTPPHEVPWDHVRAGIQALEAAAPR